MYPVPHPQWAAALRQSHRVITIVELHQTDGEIIPVPHIAGSVTADRGSSVRRKATVETPDISLLPRSAVDYLALTGARLRILRGLEIAGQPVTVPIFWGRVDDVDGDPETGPVSISASGLEAMVAADRFQAATSTRGATDAVTSITTLIRGTLPGAVVSSTASSAALGVRTWDAQSDRWAAVQEIATAVGAEAWADVDGVFHIEPLPDPLTAEVAWEIAAGPDGALISASRGWSRDGMYNVVVATGENTEEGVAGIRAIARDEDPTSPTYWAGPFGRVPRFYSSPMLTTIGQAQSAATKLLRDSVKPAVTADITALPNPALEPGDTVRVVYSDGARELHQIQSLSIDLGGGDFTLQMIGGKEDS
ncbi:DUF5047 domain-containing protein [Streptomyces xiamenensis]